MDFGRAIRIARAARDVSQKELAARTGLSCSYVSMIESGARKDVRHGALVKIAAALDLPYGTLWLLASSRAERELVYGNERVSLESAVGALMIALLREP